MIESNQAETRLASFVAFGCIHAPHQNAEAISKLTDLLRDVSPDYVLCLGDLFESDAASVHKHRAEERIDLLEEYEQAGEILEAVSESAPKARKVWLLGNHDDNLQVNDFRRIPKHLRDAIHWNRSEWGKTFKAWEQIPYEKSERGVFRLGQVNFYHGYDVSVKSDATEAVQMNNYVGGHAHTLGVRVHTHRPLPVTQVMLTPKVPAPFWYANAGTLGPLKPPYMARKDASQWAPAAVVGEVLLGRPSRMRAGPQWEAETVLL